MKSEGSGEIRQAEGIKIVLKTGFVFAPSPPNLPHEPGLLLITELSGPLLNVFEIHWMQIIEPETC